MTMIPYDLISWPHFVQMKKIKDLPINEQTRLYNQYLAEQQAIIQQMVAVANASVVGSGGTPITTTAAPTTTTTTTAAPTTTTTTTAAPTTTTTTTSP